ncbi:unnamed protein product [Spodoptera exigua]|nr:unnamed protein product [Spodoptera exigua]
MVAACSVHNAYRRSSPPLEPPIFNYVSSVENRITWGDFLSKNMAWIHHYPFSDAVWFISVRLTKSAAVNKIYMFFLHLIPATLVDGLAVCLGRKPKMLKVYRKIHKFSSVLSYFCTREIKFCNSRTRELWEKTSEADKKIYPFSMSDLNWEEYFRDYLAGIRRYLFKESDDTLPQARIKWKRPRLRCLIALVPQPRLNIRPVGSVVVYWLLEARAERSSLVLVRRRATFTYRPDIPITVADYCGDCGKLYQTTEVGSEDRATN